jgi:hypothetical protein
MALPLPPIGVRKNPDERNRMSQSR